MKNIYYFNTIQKIGGIETFFYELAKKYKDYDITIYCKDGDNNQIKRLRKYVRVKKYKKGEVIKCDKAFFNFNTDIIDNVEAKEYCLVVHGDYKWLKGKPPIHKKINKYYGVSQIACDSFTELTNIPCELAYNPIEILKSQKIIKLCSACRLDDPVKGGERTKELVKRLDKYSEETGINYIWTIFTNNVSAIDSKNVCYMKPRLDIINYIADSDYVVQLSDNFEGYNYTVNESLTYNTPVVITPCNVYKELGIDDTMSIRLDFDLSNIDNVVKEIFDRSGKFSFSYKPPKDRWNEIFEPGESTYKEEMKKMYKLKVVIDDLSYSNYDSLIKVIRKGKDIAGMLYKDDVIIVNDLNEKEYLCGDNKQKLVACEFIEEFKQEDNKETLKQEEPKNQKKQTPKKKK